MCDEASFCKFIWKNSTESDRYIICKKSLNAEFALNHELDWKQNPEGKSG